MRTPNDWLEAQRINGGSHGFECIGIARMQQVWDAAREDLRQQLAERDAEVAELKNNVTICVVRIEDLRQQLERTRLKNAIVYGTSHPEIYKTKEDELRQQVTLLRDALDTVSKCVVAEDCRLIAVNALAATAPKENEE